MTRTERLLRLARLRGDRLAIAVLEAREWQEWIAPHLKMQKRNEQAWSEAEMRAAWGDR